MQMGMQERAFSLKRVWYPQMPSVLRSFGTGVHFFLSFFFFPSLLALQRCLLQPNLRPPLE